jgi:hypothetical protein
MAVQLRRKTNYWFGVLSTGISQGDLTINSAALAAAPAINNPTPDGSFLPVALQEPSTDKFEVLWITNHAANATSATVSRAKEGSSPWSWVAGSLIGHVPLARDLRPVLSLADLAAQSGDFAVGDEAVDTTNQITHEMTNVGLRSRVYTDASGLTPSHISGGTPANAVAVLKAFAATFQPNASGNGTINFPGTPFPTGVIACVAIPSSTAQTTTQIKLVSGSATQSTIGLAAHTASGGIPTDQVNVDVIVIGC